VRKADNLPPSCVFVTKSGSLNFLEPSGPVQACNGTALPLPIHSTLIGSFTCLRSHSGFLQAPFYLPWFFGISVPGSERLSPSSLFVNWACLKAISGKKTAERGNSTSYSMVISGFLPVGKTAGA